MSNRRSLPSGSHGNFTCIEHKENRNEASSTSLCRLRAAARHGLSGGGAGGPAPWLAFDRYEQYRPSFYSGKGKLENVSGGVRLTGDARTFVLRDRKFLIHSHNSPQAALFDCELASSNPVKVVISGTADGKPFRSAPAELRPGMKQLRVELGKPGLLTVSGLEILNPGGKLDLTLRRAALEYATNPAQALLVAPALPSRLAILNPGEPVRLSVTNPTAETISFTIDGKLTHFYGKALPFRAEQKLAPGQSVTVSVPGQPALNGHWQLDWTVRSGSDAATGKAGLAILPTLPAYQAKPDDFKFGVCSHPGRWAEGERELEAQATARIGAAYVRTGVDWSNIQPTAAPPDYRLFDSVVDLFARHGIETQGMFGFCARLGRAGIHPQRPKVAGVEPRQTRPRRVEKLCGGHRPSFSGTHPHLGDLERTRSSCVQSFQRRRLRRPRPGGPRHGQGGRSRPDCILRRFRGAQPPSRAARPGLSV